MAPQKTVLDLIVQADIATRHLRPGYDDYIVVQKLLGGMKSRIPEQLQVRMDITKALSDSGINAAKSGYYDESARWFALARQAGNTDNEQTNAALSSCVAAAEAFLYWRSGDLKTAASRMMFALDKFLFLENEHNWTFLLPLRIHYAHLLSRIAFAGKDIENGFLYVLPGATRQPPLPDSAAIIHHAQTYPSDRNIVLAPLRRMAGEIAIASCLFPHETAERLPLIHLYTDNPLFREAFAEVIELLHAVHDTNTNTITNTKPLVEAAPLHALLTKGRGESIAWYGAVFHAVIMIDDPAVRAAIATYVARWTDIPVPIRQAILTASVRLKHD